MADIELSTDWVKVVSSAQQRLDYFVEASGGTIYLGKRTAQSRREKRALKTGDRGKISVPPGEKVFARADTGTATVTLERDNFSLELYPRENVDASVSSTVDISDRSGRNLGKTRVMNSSEALIDPLAAGDQPLDVSDATVDVDSTPTTANTTSTGSGNAASIDASGHPDVTVAYDTSGSSTIHVEVSADNTNWYTLTTFSPGSGVAKAQSVDIGFRYVRAYADSSLNELEISAKGV